MAKPNHTILFIRTTIARAGACPCGVSPIHRSVIAAAERVAEVEALRIELTRGRSIGTIEIELIGDVSLV